MISNDARLSVDLFTLIVSGLFACFCLIVGVYAVPWKQCSPTYSAAKEYNKLWTVRVCLQLTATAWLLCPFIQMHEGWSSHIPGFNDSPQETLCRVYAILRVGLLEPFFLMLSLRTFKQLLAITESCVLNSTCYSRDATERRMKKQPKSSNIIATAAFWASLVCFVQAIIPSIPQGNIETVEHDLHLSRSSLRTYVSTSSCWKDDCQKNDLKNECQDAECCCTACLLPLASTLISTAVVGCYLYYTWKITVKMGQLAINQSIERRMRLFRSSVSALLLSSLLFRGLTAIWKPGHVMHEFCKMMDFISMLFFVLTLSFILVIRPVREARIADKIARSINTNIFASRRYP